MNHENRKPPVDDQGQTEYNSTGGEPVSMIADKSPTFPEHAGLVAGCYVTVVQVRGDHVPPRYRRRTFWNLPSAQRAVDKAVEDGLDASMGLYQLLPVEGDDLG